MPERIKLGFESMFNGAVAGQQAKIPDAGAGECYDPPPPCVECYEPVPAPCVGCYDPVPPPCVGCYEPGQTVK